MNWFTIIRETIEPLAPFLAAAFIFMGMDFITGLTKAFATNSFESTKVKTGLFHKAGITMVLVLAVIIDVFMGFIPELPFDGPVCKAVTVLIVGMEVMSCLENIAAFVPQLADSKIIQLLLPKNESDNIETSANE